ncbi:hypothetical protein D3C75_1076960 [compost metagenome]
MRERAAVRLVSLVLRLVIADSKRFCTAPRSERRLSTIFRASSRVASGSSVLVPAVVALRVRVPSSFL